MNSTSGLNPENSHNDKSTMYPNGMDMNSSRTRLTLAILSNPRMPISNHCKNTNKALNSIVYSPTDRIGKVMDRVYGIDVMGVVPNDAFVMKPIPRDMQNNPSMRIA